MPLRGNGSDVRDERGLFRKYEVQRVDGRDLIGGDRHGADYFVLDLTHDPIARAAALMYAAMAEHDGYRTLALDIRMRVKELER